MLPAPLIDAFVEFSDPCAAATTVSASNKQKASAILLMIFSSL
jgi:hypothetical protein